jgi:DNA-binding MarR family transcriptional regulator
MASDINISDRVLSSIRQITQAIDLHSRYLAKNHGLTGPQLLILKAVARQKDTTVGGIAKNVSLSQATVTSVLDRLEKMKYVKRNRCESDKRKVIVELTEQGSRKLKKNPSLLQEHFVKEFNKLLDWEQTLLLSSIQRIASMMRAREIEAKPLLMSGPISATADDVIEFLQDDDQTGISIKKVK